MRNEVPPILLRKSHIARVAQSHLAPSHNLIYSSTHGYICYSFSPEEYLKKRRVSVPRSACIYYSMYTIMADRVNGESAGSRDAVNYSRTVPPKPVLRPGRVRVVRALYKYTARNADELSFDQGQLLYVQEHESDPNWWRAKSESSQGLIPANYVQEQMEEVEMPLHEAARRGNVSYMKECLKQGVSSTGLDSVGNTALYWAARTGHIDCLKELLSLRNPPLDAQNKMGDTPLHVAANHGYLDIVELLLQAGSNADLRNNDTLLAEELSTNASIKNTIQKYRRSYGTSTLGYGVDDYNDESD